MKRNSYFLFAFVLALIACQFITPSTSMPNPMVAASEPAQNTPSATLAPTIVATQPPTATAQAEDFGKLAREYDKALTALGPRETGTENEQMAAQYISDQFKAMGYGPETKSFSAEDVDTKEYKSADVIVVKKGDSTKQLIVGAHYDSVDVGLGTDDNASGVAVMMEAAKRVASVETPYTIVFVAFGSEENDLDGSYYYSSLMSDADVKNTIAMINIDSVAAGDITYVYGQEGDNAFIRDWTLNSAKKNNLDLQTIPNVDLSDEGDPTSDYAAFSDRGIPFIYFEATDWNLGDKDGYTQVDPKFGEDGAIIHTPDDTLQYLDATFPGRVDAHFNLYVSTLYAICTEFSKP